MLAGKIYVFRHGQSYDNKLRKFSGFRNSMLTPEGKKHAKLLGKKLKNKNIKIGYASHLSRMKNTLGEVIKTNKNSKMIIDDRIIERCYGSLQGTSKTKLERDDPKKYQIVHRGYDQKMPKGEENIKQIEKRVFEFAKELEEKIKKEKINVAVVCGNNSMRALRRYFEKLSVKQMLELENTYGTYCEYEVLGEKKEFDVITVGGATRDVFYKISDGKLLNHKNKKGKSRFLAFEYGAKIIPEETHFSFGGGGSNTAVALAKIGLKTASFISIGTEGTGDLIIENLKKAGVDTRFVKRSPRFHTAMSFVLSVKSGERVIFTDVGANGELMFDGIKKASLKNTNWIYLSSLKGKSEKLIADITSIAETSYVSLAFNPGETQLKQGYKKLSKILSETKVLLVNKEEAEKLVLSYNKSHNSKVAYLLKKLCEMGPKISVITDGKNGAYAYNGEKVFFQKAISKKVVDTTGAGDAFGSTFTGGMILNLGIKESLKIAAKNSHNVVQSLGSQEGLLEKSKLVRR